MVELVRDARKSTLKNKFSVKGDKKIGSNRKTGIGKFWQTRWMAEMYTYQMYTYRNQKQHTSKQKFLPLAQILLYYNVQILEVKKYKSKTCINLTEINPRRHSFQKPSTIFHYNKVTQEMLPNLPRNIDACFNICGADTKLWLLASTSGSLICT